MLFANGENKKAKDVTDGLRYALQPEIDRVYRKVSEHELWVDSLSLDSEDENSAQRYEQEKPVVEHIFKVVARDSTKNATRYVANLGIQIFSCTRKKKEFYSAFAEGCRGVAQEQFDAPKNAPSATDKQHKVLVILENALLPDAIYNNFWTTPM